MEMLSYDSSQQHAVVLTIVWDNESFVLWILSPLFQYVLDSAGSPTCGLTRDTSLGRHTWTPR